MSFISAETPTWLLSRRFELLLGAASVLCCLWGLWLGAHDFRRRRVAVLFAAAILMAGSVVIQLLR
jgi:hypothetical protein